jgi:hypothetical protein
MIEDIVKAFDALLEHFTWRRLTAIILFSIYVALVFAGYELFTGHFRLSRIQQAIDIVAKLQEIESKGIQPESDLFRLHTNLIRQLQDSAVPTSLTSLWKFLTAVAPWLLFTAAYLFVPLNRAGKLAGKLRNPAGVLFGLVVLALISGIVAILIPTFLWPWGNLVIYPMLSFALFVLVLVIWYNRQQPSGKNI